MSNVHFCAHEEFEEYFFQAYIIYIALSSC